MCDFGCIAGKCKESDCQRADCGNFCDDGIRYFNGICVGGECRYVSSECQYGCDGDRCRNTSVPATDTDPCENKACPDYCSGDVRYFSGRCDNGACQYSAQTCDEGCENGECVSAPADPCMDVTGDDYCDEINAYSDGRCHEGQCQYDTITPCPYGCDGNICLEYHCQWSWPQKIINKNTSEVLWPCISARPYCQMGTTLCCKKDGSGPSYPHYNCQNMETGEVEDDDNPDLDMDGMPNDWERENGLDDVTWDADLDPDGDYFTNIEEYEAGTDPQDPMSHPFADDQDRDGMSDAWERQNGLDDTTYDAGQDPDLDGHTNLEEYEGGTDPQDPMSIPSSP